MSADLASTEVTQEGAFETRQSDRLTAVPALYRTNHERLACELALQMEDPSEIFARYRYTEDQAVALMESPAFSALLQRIVVEVRETGLSFRMKAKAISEELLPHALEMATDPLTSSAVRADLIKWSAKVAGNEPKESKTDEAQRGGFNLTITFAGEKPQILVSQREPITIDQEG